MSEQAPASKLTKAAQTEALTRPVLGGKADTARQHELSAELEPKFKREARKKFQMGKMTVEEFEKLMNS